MGYDAMARMIPSLTDRMMGQSLIRMVPSQIVRKVRKTMATNSVIACLMGYTMAGTVPFSIARKIGCTISGMIPSLIERMMGKTISGLIPCLVWLV